MADEKDPGDITPDAGAAAGHETVRFTETIDEAKAKLAAEGATTVTAEGLGVDQASFDKFYVDGEFNWANYGKEQAFKAKGGKDEPAKEPATNEPLSDDGAKEAAEKAGLDWDTMGLAIVENGDIADTDRAALEAIGIPKAAVDTYIDAIKNESQDLIADVIEKSGGQESFDALFDALQTKEGVDLDAIDAKLRNPETRDEAIAEAYAAAGLTNPYTKAPATPVSGEPVNKNSGDPAGEYLGYKNFEEQSEAQRDPRYKTDAAYRGAVMAKIGASTYAMNPRAHRGGL